MKLTVRLAGQADVAALASLVRQQDAHYREGDPGEARTIQAVAKWLKADGALG